MLPPPIARRSFLRTGGISLGGIALGQLLAREGQAAGAIPRLPFAPKAKRVIWLYMAGGMSHIDTFDNKPKLAQMNGQPMPESVTKGKQIAQLQGAKLNCLAPQHPYKKWGQSGQEISVIWPKLSEACADKICIVRSLSTEAINHDPAHTFMTVSYTHLTLPTKA